MIETTSKFPTEIDALNYYSNVSISQKDTADNYATLVKKRQYTEAQKVLSDSDLFGWFAEYFNMIENRVYAVQNYLKNECVAKHPKQDLYTTDEPTDFQDITSTRELAVDDVWVSTT